MKPIIPNVVFIVLIVLSTLYLTFLTSKGGLTNNKYKGFLKRITYRGKLVFVVSLSMSLILIVQDYNNSNLNRNGELLLHEEQFQRDSLITDGIKKGVDDSRKKLFKDVSEAFANQGLRIDTLNKRIENIVTTTNILPVEKDPILHLDMGGKGIHIIMYENDPYFRVDFRCDDAGSTNFNIKSYVLIQFENDNYILEKPYLFYKSLKLSNTSTASMPLSKTVENVKEMYLYISGTYTNLSQSKSYNIDDVYRYESMTKNTRGMVFSDKQRVINLINQALKKDK
ncbi:hypothetical protein [Algibacter sp. L1A34]|uniref:hypothetical protein n=1 Tax=Algibacter sp. L1A34 TaxID=2686365 RepID=UPI00131BF995|nr:hypothetical protein [Algibacter sp. L1A34]